MFTSNRADILLLDVTAILQDLENTGENFLPFPDKISALLFLLGHSPRPMVCEN